MDALIDFFNGLNPANSSILLELSIFLVIGAISFLILGLVQARTAVKERAARIVLDERERVQNSKRSLRYSSLKAVTQLIEYTTKHYSSTNDEKMKVLRRRLIQAGIYDPRAVGDFFFLRLTLAVGLALAVFFAPPLLALRSATAFWLLVIGAVIVG